MSLKSWLHLIVFLNIVDNKTATKTLKSILGNIS